MEHGLRSPVSQELATLRVIGGGMGSFILIAAPERGVRLAGAPQWISHRAADALVRAGARLGFAEEKVGWYCVAAALAAGCLPDLLSEAIEEQEDEYAVRAR